MLTPDKIKALNAATGLNVSSDGKPPITSRADEVMNLVQQPVQPTPTTPSLSSKIGSSIVSGAKEAVGSVVNTVKQLPGKLVEDVKGAASDIQKGGVGNVTKGLVKGALRPAGDVASAIFSPVTSVIGATMDKTGAQGALEAFAKHLVDSSGIADNPSFQKFAVEHPNAEEDLNRAISLTLASQASKGKLEGVKNDLSVVKAGAEKIMGKAGEIVPKITEKVSGKMAARAAGKVADVEAGNLSKIQETISPKPTVKEARIAQSEGRLIKGQEPTFFKSGTPDEVLPSEKTIRAAKTIQKNIPDAHNMDDAQLHTALDSKTSEIAKTLKPEMQKVPIDKKVTGSAFDSWQSVKKTQAGEAEFIDNAAGNKKLQTQFEERLNSLKWDIQDKGTGKMKAPTPKTLDDVWQARKEYDASVPDNVKTANAQSDAKLQFRKQMWLQNRAILNSIINDSESGLGETSRQAFSDMHDMYNAKEGIQSKAKIETKEKPSGLSKFGKTPVGRAVKGAIKLGVGGEIVKKTLGF